MAPKKDLDLSVVIPVYGSGSTLAHLYSRLAQVLDAKGLSYEVVFVDDSSPDNSWEVLQDLQRQNPDRITAIRLMRNFGQHNALMCGLRHSRGSLIVTMDDDLQNPPEEIPVLLDSIRMSGLDLVYGRYRSKEHNPLRNIGSGVVNTFFRIVFRNGETVTSFRIIRRRLVESILTYDLNFTFLDGLLAWNSQRVGSVPVEHHPRRNGRSGYSLGRLLTLSFNLFTNFSLFPLQVVTGLGILAAMIGTLGAFCYLVQYLLSRISVPGYASIIIAVLILGGAQMLALGIIGEYLGRLHMNVNRKPQYRIREVRESSGAAGEAVFSGSEMHHIL